MSTLYSILKFLHVSAVIIWLGALITLAVLFARLASQREAGGLRLLSQQAAFIGKSLIGPAAIVTLLAGGALMAEIHAGMQAWIWWGIIGFFTSMFLGGFLMQRTGNRIATIAASSTPDAAAMAALQARLRMLGIVNIVILLSVVWAMVAKPTF